MSHLLSDISLCAEKKRTTGKQRCAFFFFFLSDKVECRYRGREGRSERQSVGVVFVPALCHSFTAETSLAGAAES